VPPYTNHHGTEECAKSIIASSKCRVSIIHGISYGTSSKKSQNKKTMEAVAAEGAMSLRFSGSNSSLLNTTMESKVTMMPAVEASEVVVETSTPATTSSSSSGNANTSTHLCLEFSDFVDLQTRLVLLPRVEEEGLGAVISSYSPPESSTGSTIEESQNTAEPSKEHRDDNDNNDEEVLPKEKGCVLIGVGSSEDDFRDKDFSSILASIREASSPISLFFATPEATISPEESSSSSHPHPHPPTKDESRTESSDHDSRNQQTDTFQSGMSALSAWGSRVRAQSERLAADAATGAAAMAGAAKERARVLQQQKQQQQQDEARKHTNNRGACEIFTQTSVGAFLPVKSAQKVTTSSLLVVRKSATEACPTKGYYYQWYRSCSPGQNPEDTASIGSHSKSSDEGVDPEELEWLELKGATNAAFQPDVTLVGRKLRCLVTLEPVDDNSSSDESDLEDVELNSVAPEEIICEMFEAVTADLTLFNGARQALARGAKFGGFQGRGNASGRQFALDVSLGMKNRRRQPVTVSSLKLFQVSGKDSVPLTDTPILQATAHADPCNPKYLELMFQVSADSMLSALCTDGHLLLETPNRLTRESFLLALGIANYQGKPANLDAKTILYRDELKVFVDDASISSGSLSFASSVRSSQKSVVTTPMSAYNSVQSGPTSPASSSNGEPDKVGALEKELAYLRSKLAKKDKVVSELQRQIAHSDAGSEEATKKLSICEGELKESKEANKSLRQSMQAAEKKLQSHEAVVLRMQGAHESTVALLENKMASQADKIAGLEKANKVLQNEKAVLNAAVEARESKLTRMGELQVSFEQLSEKVAQYDALRMQLEESGKRIESIKEDLDQVRQLEQQWKSELESAKKNVSTLTNRIEDEEKKSTSALAQLEPLQKKNQQLKGERNNYKQKNDSLSKEISRLCRSGRSIKDIEKILANHDALSEEVESLRRQKRKALEDAHTYRTSYEQSKVAQQVSGTDYETQRFLERNAELERLLAEMTEYVTAKEMQLETYKQINEQLQGEIRSLAQASLSKNEV
jgi:hypothetical protein